MIACRTVFFMQNVSTCKPGAQVVYSVWIVTIKFRILFGYDLHRQILKLQWQGKYLLIQTRT